MFYFASRCKLGRFWWSSPSRGPHKPLCQENTPGTLESICYNWCWVSCSCLGHGKFHYFLFGERFHLETDCATWKYTCQSLTQATPRLQHLLLRTLPYDFSGKYIEGSNNQPVDCLSRLGPSDDKIQLPIVQVHEITSRLQATSSRFQLLHKALHKMMICAHTNILCKLDSQANFKKYHLRSKCTGISMRESQLKLDF